MQLKPSFKQRLEQGMLRAWQHQAKWLILLRPLSLMYDWLFAYRKSRHQRHAYRAPVPVMIIGNITIGGSGKTPLIIELVRYLQARKIRVGVISRGYGGRIAKEGKAALVTADSRTDEVGDEPVLIVQQTGVTMAVAAQRQVAIELLLQQQHCKPLQLILSDDGLQHFALARDIEWVVVDSVRGFGNARLLPEGFLREPVSRLSEVTVIEHNAHPSNPLHMHLVAQTPYSVLRSCRSMAFDFSQCYAAVVGIGQPQRFFSTLQQQNIHFVAFSFADHQHYEDDILINILNQYPIITTSKDAVKIAQLWQDQPDRLAKVWVVPVRAQLSDAAWITLDDQLKTLNLLKN